MSKLLRELNVTITNLEDQIAKEDLRISAAIVEKEIGKDYWKRRYELSQKLLVARMFRDALKEANVK